jgi:tRNA(Ile2) C34 agmatinyltransferase TiaS
MTKAGSFSGYKCKNCGKQTYKAEIEAKSRELLLGERCFASPSAQRHLTKPEKRYLEYNPYREQELKPSEFRKIYDSELI